MSNFIQIGSSPFCLFEEKFTLYTKILDNNFDTITITCPNKFYINKHVNYGPKMPEIDFLPKRRYTFQKKHFFNSNLFIFECIQHYSDKISKIEPIEINVLKNEKILESYSYEINLQFPKVKIDIEKTRIDQNNGFIIMKIHSLNNVYFSIKDIIPYVKNSETDEFLTIIKKKISNDEFYKIIQETPPNFQIKDFIGKIMLPKNIPIDISFSIVIEDIYCNKFEYSSNFLDVSSQEIKYLEKSLLSIPKLIPIINTPQPIMV